MSQAGGAGGRDLPTAQSVTGRPASALGTNIATGFQVQDHVLVVFSEDDDTVPLACGGIGGIVTEDDPLVFGLPAVGEARFSGGAYLTAIIPTEEEP